MGRLIKHWFKSSGSWLKQLPHIYLITFVVMFAAAGSILLFISSASTTLKTPIQGILDRGSLGSASYSVPSGAGVAALNGVVANISWAQLQPTQGGPIVHPNQLDNALSAVAAYNKSHSNQLEVKVRIFAGIDAPNWAKTIDGWNPVNTCNNQGSPCGTFGPFWTADYDNAYKTFMTELASATDPLGYTYDSEPLLHDVTIAQCMTTFAEPFMRDDSNLGQILYYTSTTDPQPNYTGSPYSVQADENCLNDEVDNSTAWKQTHLSLSFNPFKPWTNATTQSSQPGETFTASVMQHCRAVLGSQCTIENNSIRDTYVGEQNQSGNLYYDMDHEGPDMTFQTASPNSVGNLTTTVQWAIAMGANAVELPSNYNTQTLATLDGLSAGLLANPIAGSTSPSPSVTSVSPSTGLTSGGDTVTITIANFPSGTPSSVTFGSDNGTGISRSGNTVTVTTPAHAAGGVSVVVNIGGDSATGSFTYVTPPPPQLPDLIVQSLIINPPAPAVNDHVSFSMVIKNQGTAVVPSGTPIEGEFLIDGTKVTWENDYSAGLNVGATATLSNDQGLNSNAYWIATAGNHTLEGYVNYQSTITESNYNNNTLTVSLDVPQPPPPQAPHAPTNISSPSQTSTSISLTWTASVPGTNGDPASELVYHIERNGSEVGQTAKGQTNYTDTGLNPATTYSYILFATDTAGRSSADSSAFTQATLGLDCATPAAPANFVANANADGTSVALSWSAVSAKSPCSISHYIVQENSIVIDQLTSTSYTVTNLTPNTHYTFTVIAVTNDNTAGNPATVDVTTPPVQSTTPPSAPTNLVAVAVSSSQINLTWSAATDPQSGIKLYQIERNGQVISTTTTLSFGDSGLTPNTSYTYIVIAVNGASPSLSTASAPVTATTLPNTSGGGSSKSTNQSSNPLLENTTSVGSGTDASTNSTSGSSQSYNPTAANPVSDNPAASSTTPSSKPQTKTLSLSTRLTDAFVGSGLILGAPIVVLFYLRRSKLSYLTPTKPNLETILSTIESDGNGSSRLVPGTIISPDVSSESKKEDKP